MQPQLGLTYALFLSTFSTLFSLPVGAIEWPTGTVGKTTSLETLKDDVVVKDQRSIAPVQKKPSGTLLSVQKKNLNLTLEACHRDGKDVTCDLQFTNMANQAQEINLFADCSRIIDGPREFGGFNGQIGQGSSAILEAGMTKKGFITFQNVVDDSVKAKILEVAYGTTTGDATIRFSNINIQ